ncbi:MAG: hypothetical protein JXM73_21135 [Anaerolineae bacterium]|nr:hypothetical protein [Anaerolineae bacterium]
MNDGTHAVTKGGDRQPGACKNLQKSAFHQQPEVQPGDGALRDLSGSQI